MLEVFMLGTSAGIPSLERNLPCIALRWGGEVLLFDPGECCQKSLMKYKVGYGRITNVFISHLHLDHFLGLFGLIETLRLTTDIEKLNIFAPKGFSKLLFNNWDFLNIKMLKQGLLLKGRDYSITAFKTKHGITSYGFVFKEQDKIKFDKQKAEALGIKGKMFGGILKNKQLSVNGKLIKLEDISYIRKGIKVVYTSDTLPNENIVNYAKDADLLIHDSTFDESLQKEAKLKKHSTTKDAALIAKKANVKMLVLNHISSRYKREDDNMLLNQAKKYFNNTIIAYDGMKIIVKPKEGKNVIEVE